MKIEGIDRTFVRQHILNLKRFGVVHASCKTVDYKEMKQCLSGLKEIVIGSYSSCSSQLLAYLDKGDGRGSGVLY